MTAAGAVGAFDRVLDSVGLAVVCGELDAGHPDTIDGLMERTGASRSIVREATRVLVSLGLLTAGRRVGLRVRPQEEWDTLDAHVVRWRLASPERDTQLRELRELRLAVEPAAARAAAAAASEGGLEEALLLAVADLRVASEARDGAAFLEADRRLHGMVLAASRNAMFVRLQSIIEEALRERTPAEPIAWDASLADVQLHARLVDCIVSGDSDSAADVMAQIVQGATR